MKKQFRARSSLRGGPAAGRGRVRCTRADGFLLALALSVLSAGTPTFAAEPEPYSTAEAEALRLLEPYTVINPTETSVADARAAVAAHPRDADLWHELGEALLVADDVPGAVEAYRRATRLPPKVIGRAYLHRDLALALEEAGDLPGALEAARIAVRTWPVSQQGLHCSGSEERLLVRLLVKTHDAKGALAFYRPLFEADREREECREIHEALAKVVG